jgi:methyl-accepting chemotaxis protein
MTPDGSRQFPTGRAYQGRVLLMSAALSLATVVLISAYLAVLLRMTPAQWTRFAWIIAGAFPVIFGLQALVHDRLWRPLVRCLDARRAGSLERSELESGFAAIGALPLHMFTWASGWWTLGGVVVAGGLLLGSEDFPVFTALLILLSAVCGGALMNVIHYFTMKRALTPMRNELAGEIGDVETRAALSPSVSIGKKMIVTVAGVSAVVTLFAALLSNVMSSRAIEASATRSMEHLLDRIEGDLALRGEGALEEGVQLALELGVAESVTVFDASDELTATPRLGLTGGELAAMREHGLAEGNSLGFDSPHVVAWRRLADGRVVVAHSDWDSVRADVSAAGGLSFAFFMLVCVGVAIQAARLLARDVSYATELLRSEASRLAEGDLRRGRIWEGEDELGSLWRSFETMASGLRSTVSRVAEAADRVESAAAELSPISEGVSSVTEAQVRSMDEAASSMEEIATQVRGIATSGSALNESVEESSSSILELGASGSELNETAVRLHENVEEVSSSIVQLVRSLSQVLENTEGLSGAAEETSASMEEMASSLREVDASAEETSRVSAEVVDRAEEGQLRVRETIEGMEAIQAATDTAEQVIRSLHGRTVEIGAIVDVIDDVADETNLLALNAAIIAAQAGDHGRAFGVVADEIKDLAERVLASTKEIGGLISSVQEEASRATSAIEDGSSSVARGVERSVEAGLALESITRASRQSGERMDGIVRAVQAQAKASGHVVELMERVRSGVEQIRGATQEQERSHAVVSSSSVMMRDVAQQVRGTTEEQARGSARIQESIVGVRMAVEQIDAALQEQSQACASALRGLEAVRGRTRTNEEAATTLDAVTKALRKHAHGLRDEVGRFTLT